MQQLTIAETSQNNAGIMAMDSILAGNEMRQVSHWDIKGRGSYTEIPPPHPHPHPFKKRDNKNKVRTVGMKCFNSVFQARTFSGEKKVTKYSRGIEKLKSNLHFESERTDTGIWVLFLQITHNHHTVELVFHLAVYVEGKICKRRIWHFKRGWCYNLVSKKLAWYVGRSLWEPNLS